MAVGSTHALVLSRIRFDWKRHLVAVIAVAVLMSCFLALNAVAGGMATGLSNEILEKKHDEIQFSTASFSGQSALSAAQFQALATSPGVLAASPRSVKSIGLDVAPPPGAPTLANVTQEILLAGVDPRVEGHLVVPGEPGPQSGWGFIRIGVTAQNYTLLEGTWIQGPGDAVATQRAASAGYGIGSLVVTPSRTYTVVGIIGDDHAAGFSIPGSIGMGHIVVDHATQDWPDIAGAFFKLEPEFGVIKSFAGRLIGDYPAATGSLRVATATLERQYFEEARTQSVLAAAARLVGLVGAATIFAMSLFLLIGERKTIGTMAALGFTRARLAAYMNGKMLLLAVLGAALGGALGALLVLVLPMPTMSFLFAARVDTAAFGLAALETLAAALGGSLLAFFLTIRQDPIQAIRVTE